MKARLGKIHFQVWLFAGFSHLRAAGLWASAPYMLSAGSSQISSRQLSALGQACKNCWKEKTRKIEVMVFCNLIIEVTQSHCCHNHFGLRKWKSNQYCWYFLTLVVRSKSFGPAQTQEDYPKVWLPGGLKIMEGHVRSFLPHALYRRAKISECWPYHMLARVQSNRTSHTLLVRMQNVTAILENSLAVKKLTAGS